MYEVQGTLTCPPTPTPRQRAILKKEAKRTYGFPAVGINMIFHYVYTWYTVLYPLGTVYKCVEKAYVLVMISSSCQFLSQILVLAEWQWKKNMAGITANGGTPKWNKIMFYKGQIRNIHGRWPGGYPHFRKPPFGCRKIRNIIDGLEN